MFGASSKGRLWSCSVSDAWQPRTSVLSCYDTAGEDDEYEVEKIWSASSYPDEAMGTDEAQPVLVRAAIIVRNMLEEHHLRRRRLAEPMSVLPCTPQHQPALSQGSSCPSTMYFLNCASAGLLVAGGVALFDCEWRASLVDVDADGFSPTNGSVREVVREEGRRSGAIVLYSNVSFPLQRLRFAIHDCHAQCSCRTNVASLPSLRLF
jgi:hypothetical protein